jgi:hypothetical protein
MAAMTASASRIHGHTGVEDSVGAGEVVAVATAAAELGELVWGADDVGAEVDVTVDVDVFVGALVVVLVGALVVRDATGVREGSVGRPSERDALGRFEPPPHDAARTAAIARIALDGSRILVAGLLHPLELWSLDRFAVGFGLFLRVVRSAEHEQGIHLRHHVRASDRTAPI